MAAITVNSTREVVIGSTREILLNADVTDTYTYQSSFHKLLGAQSNVPGKITSITGSGVPVLITFAVTAGPANGALIRLEGL